MKKIILVATLAFSGFVAASIFAGAAESSATSKLNKCRFDDRQQVIDCCQQVIEQKRMPYWMVENGGSCQSSVVCIGGKRKGYLAYASQSKSKSKKPLCYIAVSYSEGGKKGDYPKYDKKPNVRKDFKK